jgi:microcystin-dependent protein
MPNAGIAASIAGAVAPVLVPVGTVIACFQTIDVVHPAPPGWYLCDGTPLNIADAPDLFKVIGTSCGDGRDSGGNKVGDFNLPDLRGSFLRGVDMGRGIDLDARTRQGANGGHVGDTVGSVQLGATALPSLPFNTNAVPDHQHVMPFEISAGRSGTDTPNTVAYPAKGAQASTQGAGGHQHTIQGGGDRETRPYNVSVSWIIRIV